MVGAEVGEPRASPSSDTLYGIAMKSPKSCIEPPGPSASKQDLQDFLARAEQWAKDDPDDLSVTWVIRAAQKSLARVAREGRKTTLGE